MSRKKIKQVDAIRQKTLENVIEEFLRHCRLKNLSPRTLEYYEEDLSYFQRSVPVESVREVTREVMEDFIDHEMQKGNRITAMFPAEPTMLSAGPGRDSMSPNATGHSAR